MTNSIRCKKCKKVILYLPEDYEMSIKVECAKCHDKVSTAKNKETLASKYARMKKGPRKDIDSTSHFRSATEANFARILNYLGVEWQYEERVFTFSNQKYKTKPWIYVMDFTITKGNDRFNKKYIEVKGYMSPQSKQKLRRLRHNYPEDANNTIIIIYSKYNKKDILFCNKLNFSYVFYDELSKEFKDKIPEWEGK